MSQLRADLAFAIRRWLREPLFAAGALITLALGIGANTATFSLLHGILLEPLPSPEADRLVLVWEVDDRGRSMRVSTPNFEDWKAQATSFAELASFSKANETTVLGGGEPVRATQSLVGRGFFEALAVPVQLGRTFVEEEQTENAPDTVVLSDRFWRQVLGAPADLESLRLQVSGVDHRVVGVLPPGVELPEDADLWTPKEIYPDTSDRTAHNWRVVGRLAPGFAETAAATEMSVIARRLREQHGSPRSR